MLQDGSWFPCSQSWPISHQCARSAIFHTVATTILKEHVIDLEIGISQDNPLHVIFEANFNLRPILTIPITWIAAKLLHIEELWMKLQSVQKYEMAKWVPNDLIFKDTSKLNCQCIDLCLALPNSAYISKLTWKFACENMGQHCQRHVFMARCLLDKPSETCMAMDSRGFFVQTIVQNHWCSPIKFIVLDLEIFLF